MVEVGKAFFKPALCAAGLPEALAEEVGFEPSAGFLRRLRSERR